MPMSRDPDPEIDLVKCLLDPNDGLCVRVARIETKLGTVSYALGIGLTIVIAALGYLIYLKGG
jgi:hypothetical protein